MGATVPRRSSIRIDHHLGRTPGPPGWWARAVLRAAAPRRCPMGTNRRLSRTPIPPVGGPAPKGVAPPRKRSIGIDRRRDRTPCPPSWWARANGVCRPPQALRGQRPPPGPDSRSPRLVGPGHLGAAVPRRCSVGTARRMGRTPRPANWWARADGGATVPQRRSMGSNRRLGRTPRPPGRWDCAERGCRPPQALRRWRPPPRQDSPFPQPVGPRRWGLPSPACAP